MLQEDLSNDSYICFLVLLDVCHLLFFIWILKQFTTWNTTLVCTSGALFGLLEAILAELLTNWTIYGNKVLYIIIIFCIGKQGLWWQILSHVSKCDAFTSLLVNLDLAVGFMPRRYSMADFVPAAIIRNSYYISHGSAIGHNACSYGGFSAGLHNPLLTTPLKIKHYPL
jgi:hypothetical protein